jgi:hypothetical protein
VGQAASEYVVTVEPAAIPGDKTLAFEEAAVAYIVIN